MKGSWADALCSPAHPSFSHLLCSEVEMIHTQPNTNLLQADGVPWLVSLSAA
jgi:hypothetical protein